MNKELREMLEMINNKKTEARELVNSNKLEEATSMKSEIQVLQNKFDLMKDLYEDEMGEVENMIEIKDRKVENKANNDVFAKYIKRENLTSKEQDLLLTDVRNGMSEGSKLDGGALVPFDEDTSITSLREADDALQNLVTVVPVKTLSGKKTVRKRRTGGSNFKKVGEGKSIGKGTNPQYVELGYSCDKYAAIYDITNELIDDSTEDVVKELNTWIGHDSRECRNNLILDELGKKTERVDINGFDDIKDILNTKLNTANAKFASIITNQDGYNFLDKIKDATGNYILEKLVGESDKYVVKGKKVYVYDNTILPTTDNKIPMIIGDMKMAIVLFDRQTVAVKVTTDGADAYENDLTLLRAIEREDIQTLDDEAFVYGEIPVSTSSKALKK
ncbi:phage major capsid protein [Romboutsia sedimentorum]|uniref:phage major capsid protein n=1 Tax=Romboutsia sedimentorum TaxID=1368474 RepID=UPI0024DEF7C2|nr:phage major capsid protein [Romboutsia sedimentorum]MDK2587458.1 phage major capsid protein [Romboutsia sedimentorum]